MSNARYYFSNKRILDGEIKGAKVSSLFYLISKHWWNINFLCIFFMNNLWVWVIVEKDLAWESSRHFPTPPLVSPRNWIWGTRAEIPYRWRVTSQIWVLIGWSKFHSRIDQSEAPSRSGLWHVISMEFYGLVPQTSFCGKPAVASFNVGRVDFDFLEFGYLAFNLLFFLSGPWCWPGLFSQIAC